MDWAIGAMDFVQITIVFRFEFRIIIRHFMRCLQLIWNDEFAVWN